MSTLDNYSAVASSFMGHYVTLSQLKRLPVLRKLWQMEKEAGKDVTLKDGAEFDLEAAEKEDQEREERRKEREGEEGEGRRRR